MLTRWTSRTPRYDTPNIAAKIGTLEIISGASIGTVMSERIEVILNTTIHPAVKPYSQTAQRNASAYAATAAAGEYFASAAALARLPISSTCDRLSQTLRISLVSASASPGSICQPISSSSITQASSDPSSVNATIGFPAAMML